MCDGCRAREADPRSKAVVTVGILDTLPAKQEIEGCDYVRVTVYGDPAVATFRAYQAQTDEDIQQARAREWTYCLN